MKVYNMWFHWSCLLCPRSSQIMATWSCWLFKKFNTINASFCILEANFWTHYIVPMNPSGFSGAFKTPTKVPLVWWLSLLELQSGESYPKFLHFWEIFQKLLNLLILKSWGSFGPLWMAIKVYFMWPMAAIMPIMWHFGVMLHNLCIACNEVI